MIWDLLRRRASLRRAWALASLVFVAVAVNSAHADFTSAAQGRPSCGSILDARMEVRVSRIRLPENLPGLSPEHRVQIRRFIKDHGLSVVNDGEGNFKAMAFDHRHGQKDRGYLLVGILRDQEFDVTAVVVGHGSTAFFKRVATARGLLPMDIDLRRMFYKCPSLKIPPWVQVKLQIKHRLSVVNVINFLNVARAREELPAIKEGLPSKIKVVGQDRSGRTLEAFIDHYQDCPNQLMTTYEIH